MCGIAGVRRFGDTPITGEELVILLCALEHRGSHATGLAIVNPEDTFVLKGPVPAWKFTKDQRFANFLQTNLKPETSTVLLHTRWATTGNPEVNSNNHPIFDDDTAIVHNGMISNHFQLFGQNKFPRTCETDSDVIRAIIRANGLGEKGLRELSKMSGSAAIACVSKSFPEKLLLARSGSPLMFGFSENGDKLYWASESQAISKAVRPFRKIRGVWVQDTKANISIGSMPDDTAWLFGPNEIEFHHKFSTCSFYKQPDYSKMRESYHTKVKNWKADLRREAQINRTHTAATMRPIQAASTNMDLLKGAVIKCPGCGTGNSNPKGMPWEQLTCGKCDCALKG